MSAIKRLERDLSLFLFLCVCICVICTKKEGLLPLHIYIWCSAFGRRIVTPITVYIYIYIYNQ